MFSRFAKSLAVGAAQGYLSSGISRATGTNDQHNSFVTSVTGGSPGNPMTGPQFVMGFGNRLGAGIYNRLHANSESSTAINERSTRTQFNITSLAGAAAFHHIASGAGLQRQDILPPEFNCRYDHVREEYVDPSEALYEGLGHPEDVP